jgi:hypothetical protein
MCNHRLHFRETSSPQRIFLLALFAGIRSRMRLNILNRRTALPHSHMLKDFSLGPLPAVTNHS